MIALENQQHNVIKSELKSYPHFWIGEDLPVLDRIVIEPGISQKVSFSLPKASLPPIEIKPQTFETLLSTLNISMRSRIAQVGLEIESELHFEGEKDGVFLGSVAVKSLGNCPLVINKGECFACLYHPAGSTIILGKNLKQTIGTGLIIDGEKEKDWNFFRIEHIGHKWHTHGVLLKIDPHHMWRVGNCSQAIDILNPTIRDFRQELEKTGMLERISTIDNESFWVGQTASAIHIPPGFNGILSNQVYDGQGNQLGFIQTESNLIRGGETDWKIRTEFMVPSFASPILLDHTEIFIALVLFKDKDHE